MGVNKNGFVVHDVVETLTLPILLHQKRNLTIKVSSIILEATLFENTKLIEVKKKPPKLFFQNRVRNTIASLLVGNIFLCLKLFRKF